MAKEAASHPWQSRTRGGDISRRWPVRRPVQHLGPDDMHGKVILIAVACLVAAALAAPADKPDVEVEKDLAAGDKGDLKTAASHWGGHYGGWGGWGYGGYGGGYPYYGSWGGWGWPSYGYGGGYGYWPYGGYYGHGFGGYGWW